MYSSTIPEKPIRRKQTGLLSLLWALVLMALVGAAALGGVIYKNMQANAARDALTKQYGARAVALCPPQSTKVQGKLASAADKFLVIDNATGLTYSRFQDALSPDQAAGSTSDLTAVICVGIEHSEIENCPYSVSGDNSSTDSYHIQRFENDARVVMIDVSTGQTTSVNTLAGGDPPECPSSTDESGTREGEPPTAQDFQNWLDLALQNVQSSSSHD